MSETTDRRRDESARVDFGYRTARLQMGWCSTRVPTRATVAAGVIFAVAILLALISITLGDFLISLDRVIGTVLGFGNEQQNRIVLGWRLPIAIAAVVFGALLGLGGAIFQSLTRNPLGSPDIIGFSSGAYTAVVVAMLVVGTAGFWPIAAAATIGGLLTALAVYLLAYRRGVEGFRLIIVGIGVTAVLGSLNAYLITRAELEDAMSVGFWGAGSIHRVTWSTLVPSLAVAAVIVLAAMLLSRDLRHLELGDDAAITHGVRPDRSRLALLVVGVMTVALVTAAAGPIGFVALVAPHLARRITRAPGVDLVGSAAMGAAVLAASHLLSIIVQQVFRPIPVGLITVCFGGIYLIWLLIRHARRHDGDGGL